MREIKFRSTGLLDKNGTEIYEGDIVNSPRWIGVFGKRDAIGVVVYSFDREGYRLKVKESIMPIDQFYKSDIEVIGNIHENPELLQ